MEDIQEQKDDLANEDNKDLNLEDRRAGKKSSPMTCSDLRMKVDILNYMARLLPEGARSLYVRTLSALVTQLRNALPQSDEEEAILESRFKSFAHCMTVIVGDPKRAGTCAIDELASYGLEDWQNLDDTIDHSFSADEMTSFCCRLDTQGKAK